MSTTPTAAPSRANRSAPARPIPEAAAVTMPILPSSLMLPLLPSSGDLLAVVERVERGAVRLTDHMSLDLQGRRHLAVGDGKRFVRDHKTPHPLARREGLVDPRHRSADRLDE